MKFQRKFKNITTKTLSNPVELNPMTHFLKWKPGKTK